MTEVHAESGATRPPRAQRLSGEQRREQILAAAFQLFASRGFSGTTTRQIAEAAGISEAALYLHFVTKEALYEELIRSKAIEHAAASAHVRDLAEADAPPRELFLAVARFMLETHTRDRAFLRLLLFSGLEQHALFRMFFEAQIRGLGSALWEYVERHQERGVFRPGNPRLAVRGFLGMLVHHLLVQEVFSVAELGVFPPDEVAPQLVTIFLDGLCAGTAPDAGGVPDAI